MKETSASLINLCIILVLVLSACGPMNPSTPELADLEELPEESPQVMEADLKDLLQAGTAMKWYDESYLVFVPAGEVSLGDNDIENNLEHSTYLDDFWIYMFMVTNGQYRQCVQSGNCTPPASEPPYPDLEDPEIKDLPVVGVTWEQADNYCQWMNASLPTEAQWEKAARGPQASTYPWGEDEINCDLLNYSDCELKALSPVYQYQGGKSFYDIYDLAGNAYEWVFDWYDAEYPAMAPQSNPTGPQIGTERSIRGSSYQSGEDLIPSAQRFYLDPGKYRLDLGFRCVTSGPVPETFANACLLTSYVSNVPAPWQPGPPPDNEEPLPFSDPICSHHVKMQYQHYCADPDIQQGGLDVQIMADDDNLPVYLKSWHSDYGAICLEGNGIGCFGPEGTPILLEVCDGCVPDTEIGVLDVYCEAGYSLIEEAFPPECGYDGGEPNPGESCPAGFVYDLNLDICVKLGPTSLDCPSGYSYDPDQQCCIATYAVPQSGSEGSAESYLPCPPGYGNIKLVGYDTSPSDYVGCYYYIYGTYDVHCFTPTLNLGDCQDQGCKNPGSYSTKNSCENAGCKWIIGATGGDVCVHP